MTSIIVTYFKNIFCKLLFTLKFYDIVKLLMLYFFKNRISNSPKFSTKTQLFSKGNRRSSSFPPKVNRQQQLREVFPKSRRRRMGHHDEAAE